MSKNESNAQLLHRISELEEMLASTSTSSTESEIPEFTYRSLFMHMLHEVHIWRLVRDENGEITSWTLVDANPAALNSWGMERSEVIGKTTNEIFDTDAVSLFMPIVSKVFSEMKPHAWVQEFPATGQVLHMVTIPLGELFVSTGFDITEKRKAEKKQEKLLRDLQQALKEVKTLRGLLPICAKCKKIRDSEENWIPLERYLHDHSDAEFTHGYCPECYEKAVRKIKRDDKKNRN